MSEYVGLKQGKIHDQRIISEYYCGGCGWPVTDHDSYCSECGGELHEGMGKRMSGKMYAVKTWSDLDDRGEYYIERKLYRTREKAERRAEEVEAWSDDEMYYNAMVVEFEVVE